ncbi:MAG: TonB-dependent receptor [Pseudomonadales bacterium]|nr:TonB-dependent receptor [Pseudomonadales bacterium]
MKPYWIAATATAAVVALTALPGPARAEEAASASGTRVIEEITVTARRRAEVAQDVPLAISTIGGQQLEDTGTFNVYRLQTLQPSLQFFSSNPRNTAVNLRGIGAPFGLTNDGIEQGVGIYVDQVYYSRIAASTFDFLDVDQIEVLRGPQGTLYGKNTTSGALNITTRAPSFVPEGSAEVSSGSLGFVQARGALSGPLLDDRVAYRLVTSATRRDGLYENVTTTAAVNEIDNLGIRGQLLFVASERLDITLAGDFNRQDPECCALLHYDVAPTLRPANRQYESLAAASGYQPPSRDPYDRKLAADSELNANQKFGGASLRAEWNLDAGTVTSVTAWRYWDWGPSNDRDFTGLPITTVSANPSKQRQWTQEVRFATPGDRRVDYVAGLFAFRQTIESTGIQAQGSAASLWLLGPVNGANPALLDGLRQETAIDFENDSVALFGQATWNVTERFRVQPGLRVNYDTKNADYAAVASGGLDTADPVLIARKNSVLQSQAYVADFDDWNVSGDLNLSWRASDDILLYGLYARSFKSGGVNLSGIPNRADGTPALETAQVDPEAIDHYEIGAKTEWLDGRARLNLALFRTEIQDYQATVVSGAIGVLRGYLANAEEVRTQGVEADFRIQPTDSLHVYVNAAYTDAVYESFDNAPPPLELSGGAVQFVDISGKRLPGVSKWAFSYGAEYARPISAGGARGEGFLAVDGNYRTEWSSNPSPSEYMWVDGYGLINVRGGFRSDGNWSVGLWIRNAFDKDYVDFLAVQPGSTGLIVAQVGEPRTYGLSVNVSF